MQMERTPGQSRDGLRHHQEGLQHQQQQQQQPPVNVHDYYAHYGGAGGGGARYVQPSAPPVMEPELNKSECDVASSLKNSSYFMNSYSGKRKSCKDSISCDTKLKAFDAELIKKLDFLLKMQKILLV